MDMQPKADNLLVPVFVPNEGGDDGWQIGSASLEEDTLTVKFDDSVIALAVQRAMARGEVVGLTVVKIEAGEPDEEEPGSEPTA